MANMSYLCSLNYLLKKGAISEIFESREERMSVFWELIKQKREKKEALKGTEWQSVVENDDQEAAA